MAKRAVINAGHRNNKADYGASGNGLREADIALKIAKYADAYLKSNYTGIETKMTRTSNDRVIALSALDDIADDWNADVFVSIHLNAFNQKADGFETFIYNGGVSKATVTLQSIMHSEILSTMRKFGDIEDRGQKRANHSVTRETEMPAILTENLFIDSPSDAKYLKQEVFIKAVGEAHARGIAKFLKLPAKPTPKPAPTEPSTVPGKDNYIHRVIVDGDQVGAFGKAASVADSVEKAVLNGAKKIEVERV